MPEKIQILIGDTDLIQFVYAIPRKGLQVFLYAIDSLLDIAKTGDQRLFIFPHAVVPELTEFYPNFDLFSSGYKKDFTKEWSYAVGLLWKHYKYIEIRNLKQEAEALKIQLSKSIANMDIMELEELEKKANAILAIVFREPIYWTGIFLCISRIDQKQLVELKCKLKQAIQYTEQHPFSQEPQIQNVLAPLISDADIERIEESVTALESELKPEIEYAGFKIYNAKTATVACIRYRNRAFIVSKGKVRKEDIVILYNLICARGAYRNTETLRESLEHWYQATDNTVHRSIANIRKWLGKDSKILKNQRTTGYYIMPDTEK